jgi:beta-xylosidase
LKALTIIFVVLHGTLFTAFSQQLENPLILENEWSGYSIGDPYVLKHRGVFYLYCSTKDSETGVKCWSSRDLVQWKYEGLCSTDPVTRGAYAPEVIYLSLIHI